MKIRPQYYARRDGDGSWSIVHTQTHKVAVIAEILPLTRLDESTAMEIIDALSERHSASEAPGTTPERDAGIGLSRFS
ncbi:hypothetical protein RGR602_PC02013 (plasmid) [Rhizobium gallicum bv. gallicum R602sp]|uniref:Uncharacterized protein n=1 Tax=Rhizobium gallicum bv. gallicum R602sp TaxID=1041138 RepID=A0A0B4XG39_9HYPH|nr:hypothetical protein RGR602_PC02013 [Rhizobium gallicum bv. gallicum R602sp]